MDEEKLIKLSNFLADIAIRILDNNAEQKATPRGDNLEVVKCATRLASDLIQLQITKQNTHF
jgi:hypothetical protein